MAARLLASTSPALSQRSAGSVRIRWCTSATVLALNTFEPIARYSSASRSISSIPVLCSSSGPRSVVVCIRVNAA
jgi:hypothetical protein